MCEPKPTFQTLTDTLDSYLNMGIPFYDCIVMKDGKCVYRHWNGFTDLTNRTPVTGRERYNIYSCTKLITCVAALQLWEKGLFRLEDKLSDYMREFAHMTVHTPEGVQPAKNPIRIQDLFTMTAGFSYNLNSPHLLRCREETAGQCQTREAMKYLAQEPLLFEPGTRWEYSLCHDVLAALVEVISGMTFGEYVKQNIFAPLNMTHSTLLLDDSEVPTLVNPYRYCPEKGVVETDRSLSFKLGSLYESGGAGCISTVEDYILLLEGLRTGVILKSSTIDRMATNHLNPQQLETFWTKETHGYGLGQKCPRDDTQSDFGWGGAAGAHYFVDRKNGITAYLGIHVLGYADFQNTRVEITPLIQKILA